MLFDAVAHITMGQTVETIWVIATTDEQGARAYEGKMQDDDGFCQEFIIMKRDGKWKISFVFERYGDCGWKVRPQWWWNCNVELRPLPSWYMDGMRQHHLVDPDHTEWHNQFSDMPDIAYRWWTACEYENGQVSWDSDIPF